MSENRTRLIRPQTRADGKLKSGNGKSKSSTAKNTGSPPPFLFFVGARGEPGNEARNNLQFLHKFWRRGHTTTSHSLCIVLSVNKKNVPS